jgi:hypothetical protein
MINSKYRRIIQFVNVKFLDTYLRISQHAKYQGCLDLCFDAIYTGSQGCFDLLILQDGFEKLSDRPTVLLCFDYC